MVRSWIAVQTKVLFLGCYLVSWAAYSQIDTFSADSTKADPVKLNPSTYDQLHIYIYPQVAVPLGELRDVIQNSYGNVGIGIAGGVLIDPKRGKASPLLIGLDAGYMIYGVDKIPANAAHGNIKSTFSLITIGLAGRLIASQYRRFTPFVDGMFGVKIFNLQTKIDKSFVGSLSSSNSDPQTIDNYSQGTMSYSAGAGFFLRQRNASNGRVGFSVRFLYSWGLELKYVPRNTVYVDANNNLQYQTAYTDTNMFMIQFGIQVY